MKRLYIITGAAGHLASTIIRYLRGTNCLIRGLILPGEVGEDDRQVEYFRGDVTNPGSLEALFNGTERNEVFVIHAAEIVSIDDEETTLLNSVNVDGTMNVIFQCARHHVKRLVYIGTANAIQEQDSAGASNEISAFSEDNEINSYAKTKAIATQLCLKAASDGLNVVIVQPSGMLGPYDNGKNYIVQLIKHYMTGRLKSGVTGGYDFVDVRDVAMGCISACDHGNSGECYNLSNRYVTIPELFEYIRLVLGRKHKKVCFPNKLVRLVMPAYGVFAKLTRTRPLITRFALYSVNRKERFSHNKATTALLYHPRDIRETVADTIAFLNGQPVPM